MRTPRTCRLSSPITIDRRVLHTYRYALASSWLHMLHTGPVLALCHAPFVDTLPFEHARRAARTFNEHSARVVLTRVASVQQSATTSGYGRECVRDPPRHWLLESCPKRSRPCRVISSLVYSTPVPRYPTVCDDVAHSVFGESLDYSTCRAA